MLKKMSDEMECACTRLEREYWIDGQRVRRRWGGGRKKMEVYRRGGGVVVMVVVSGGSVA